jgi:hypothetical protein
VRPAFAGALERESTDNEDSIDLMVGGGGWGLGDGGEMGGDGGEMGGGCDSFASRRRTCARPPRLRSPPRPRHPRPAAAAAQIGHTTDGGYGYGFKNDTGSTDEYPYDDALAQKIAGEVGGPGARSLNGRGIGAGAVKTPRPRARRAPGAHPASKRPPPTPPPPPGPCSPPTPQVLDDKIEEEDDRQAILGKDILNPTTGLTLVDYLEGREGQHNELLFKRLGLGHERDADTYINTEVGGGASRGGGDVQAALFICLRPLNGRGGRRPRRGRVAPRTPPTQDSKPTAPHPSPPPPPLSRSTTSRPRAAPSSACGRRRA